jgi:hypothetical protein
MNADANVNARASAKANARLLLGALASLLLVPACGAGSADAKTSVLLSIWNGGGADAGPPPARPSVLDLNWLDDAGFLIRNRAIDVGAGTDDFLGSLLIDGSDAPDAGSANRRVYARGLAGGKAVSEGWGTGQMVPGVQERPLSMRMLVLPDTAMDPYDQDGDQVPDAVDRCPTLADPDQLPTDC